MCSIAVFVGMDDHKDSIQDCVMDGAEKVGAGRV